MAKSYYEAIHEVQQMGAKQIEQTKFPDGKESSTFTAKIEGIPVIFVVTSKNNGKDLYFVRCTYNGPMSELKYFPGIGETNDARKAFNEMKESLSYYVKFRLSGVLRKDLESEVRKKVEKEKNNLPAYLKNEVNKYLSIGLNMV